MDKYTIIAPTSYEAAHYEAVLQLTKQLTARPITFTEAHYRHLLDAPDSHLFLLGSDQGIVGMLTVGIYHTPTGVKAWIEDVVVDTSCRGLGLGRMLVAHAIDYCRAQGISTLMLTSKPQRVAANALYRSLGFAQKETNVYFNVSSV